MSSLEASHSHVRHHNLPRASQFRLCCASIAILAGTAAAQSFTPLGYLKPHTSRAYAVSDSGVVVVGATNSNQGYQAFRWTAATGMQPLGAVAGPEGVYSVAFRMSTNGVVITGDSSNTTHSARWTPAGISDLSTPPTAMTSSSVRDLSDDGALLLCEASGPMGSGAYFWTEGVGFTPIPDLAGDTPAAMTTDGGVIVGATESANGDEAFRWDAGGKQILGNLGGPVIQSAATDCSADGSVVVGASRNETGSREAFRWTASTGMVGLGFLDPANQESGASRTSADGTVIVGHSRLGGSAQRPFIWTEQDGMRLLHDVLTNDLGLDLAGWSLTEASDMSSDGTVIVGFGTNPDGHVEAWVARLTPSPCWADVTTDGACDPGSGDGVTTLSDFSCYLSSWSAGDAVADITQSGICDPGAGGDGVDLSDFSCYLSLWSAGCP